MPLDCSAGATERDSVPFPTWESVTQRPLYKGQLAPVRRWIRGRVLDVASHYGRFSALSPEAVSLDMQERFLRRGVQIGTITRPVAGSAMDLPFKDRSFDSVLAMGIMDHIPPRLISSFLDELVRVAADEARIFVQVTSPFSLYAVGRVRYFGEGNHPYSPFRLARHLRRRGWLPLTSFSSGLVGHLERVPRTVEAFVPWAIHITVVFSRDRRTDSSERNPVSDARS